MVCRKKLIMGIKTINLSTIRLFGNGSRLMVHGTRLVAHGSRRMAQKRVEAPELGLIID